MAAHPEVAEAAVLGADDEKSGQRLVAFGVPIDGAAIEPDALKSYVREGLATYKVPRTITVLDEFPPGSTGKVLRRELQNWWPRPSNQSPAGSRLRISVISKAR